MILLILVLKYLILLLICLFVLNVILNFSPGGKTKKAVLVAISSGTAAVQRGEKWDLGKGVLLGRGSECTVNLPDPFVSSRHARIILQDEKYYVTDLGSKNGTLLDDRPLTFPQQLHNGSHLKIGGFVLKALIPEKKEAGKSLLRPLFPGLILAAGGLELYWQQLLKYQDIGVLMAAALMLVISSYVVEYKGRGDPLVIQLIGVLSALGLILIYRVNPYYGIRQSYWVIVGFGLYWAIQIFLVEYKRLLNYKYTFMVLSIVFLAITILFGVEAGGARSWLSLGSFHFQPSEFVKIFMVIFLAGYLDENKEILRGGTLKFGPFYLPDWPYLGPLLAVCGLSLLLLVFQKDLGMALLFFAIFLVMVYIATDRSYFLLLGLGLFSAGTVLMYHIFPHVQNRLSIYLNPLEQMEVGGYQVVQSLFAIGGGGIFGQGFGSGFPTLIPAVHTDFIFSLMAEELGLLGALAIIGIYFILVWKGIQTSLQASDDFGLLMACGFSSILAIQTLIIIGGVTNLIPLTGIPLPFLSYGGSSFISNCFLIGMLSKISAERESAEDLGAVVDAAVD